MDPLTCWPLNIIPPIISRCRNSDCSGEISCVCPTATPTLPPVAAKTLCCLHVAGAGDFCLYDYTGECDNPCVPPGSVLIGTPTPTPGKDCSGASGANCSRQTCLFITSSDEIKAGPGETVPVTMAGRPAYCPGVEPHPDWPSTFTYNWFAVPQIQGSAEVHDSPPNIWNGWQLIDPCIERYKPGSSWNWGVYQEYQPSESGYLESVNLAVGGQIGAGTGEIWVNTYFDVLVTDSNGVRLTENTGENPSFPPGALTYGGVERYVIFYPYSAPSRWPKFVFKIKPYLEKGKTYRIYVNPRAGSYASAYWIKFTGRSSKPNQICAGCYESFFYIANIISSSRLPLPTFENGSDSNGEATGEVLVRMPEDATIGTSWDIIGDVSDSDSALAGPYSSGTCFAAGQVIPPQIVNWFQTKDADVYSRLNIKSLIPQTAVEPYFSIEGDGGSPGVVIYGGSKFDFNNADVSEQGLLANDQTSRMKIDYQYLFNRLRIDAETATIANDKTLEEQIDDRLVYLSENSLDIGTEKIPADEWNIPANKKIIVFINGNLNVNKNIIVPQGSFLALIASGDISFAKGVTKAQGWYVSSGEIIVNGSEIDGEKFQFIGEGAFVGWEGVRLNRMIANLTLPAEKFIARPDFWLNAPEEFMFSLTYREEMLP